MKNALYVIQFRYCLKANEMTTWARAYMVFSRIQNLLDEAWTIEDPMQRIVAADLIEKLTMHYEEGEDNEKEFTSLMREVFDFCDDNRIWVTIE